MTVLLASGINFLSFAQAKEKIATEFKNAAFLEIGGAGLLYSIGYERTWHSTKHFAATSGIGFTYVPSNIMVAFIESGVLLRHQNVALELGAALSFLSEGPRYGSFPSRNGNANTLFLVPRIGIRVFTNNQRWHFRAGYTPVREIQNNDNYYSPIDKQFYRWANIFTVARRF